MSTDMVGSDWTEVCVTVKPTDVDLSLIHIYSML